MKHIKEYPAQEELLNKFNYDPETGILSWSNNAAARWKGKRAGSVDTNGYRYVRFNKVAYKEHRLIYIIMTGSPPEHLVDHINHTRDDNRWSNLQDVTMQENKLNSLSSGDYRRGVYPVASGKYSAYTSRTHGRQCLGTFATEEEAKQARNKFDYEHS